ncbi:YPDG domain-containing protein [Corynebacterium sp. MC-17D]|uniref:YPDG domain-containing protein n=1 Tax=Corynebacterium lipophilum TaxID=2804918 RepID=A0AAW5HXK4_9CORY|nr:Rib/alpha-like domain-containing protein [Corynebacterium lipophilum]MCO6395072.1 YPDG domain-containing protein [Corynebacterium lipophilum]MCZ2116898.1 YPDG domain-containing protein [Corynebacterium lipophilum]
MNATKYTAVLATTAALIGAGLAAPQLRAEETAAASDSASAASQSQEAREWRDAEITAGDTITVEPSVPLPEGAKAVGPTSIDGWKLTTDEKTGAVTIEAAPKLRPGQGLRYRVLVLFADKTTATYDAEVTVVPGGNNNAHTSTIEYKDSLVQPKQSVTVTPTGTFPQGTKFYLNSDKIEKWEVSVDEATGAVTVKAGDIGYGSWLSIPVRAEFPDGSSDVKHAKVTVADQHGNTTPPSDRLAAKHTPEYTTAQIAGNETATLKQTAKLPEGTKFKILGESKLWDLSIDATTGTITAKPKQPLAAGAVANVPVIVTYSDESQDFVQAKVEVTKDPVWQSSKASVDYPVEKSPADETATITPALKDVPEGTKFAMNATPPTGWEIGIAPVTGVVTVNAPEGTRAGTQINVPVRVEFPDGSRTVTNAVVLFEAPTNPESDKFKVTYKDVTVKAGENRVFKPTEALPTGATVNGPKNQSVNGVKVNTDKDGAVSVEVPSHARDFDFTVPLEIYFRDGSKQETKFHVTVKAKETTTPKTSETKPSTEPSTEPSTTKATTSAAEPSAPRTTEPTSEEPTTSAPRTTEPTSEEPTTSAPRTSEQPSTEPTSEPSTTKATTSAAEPSAPRTTEPTSEEPTTSAPRTTEEASTSETTPTTSTKPSRPQNETTKIEYARTPVHAGESVTLKPKGEFPAGTKFNGPSGSQQGWSATTNSQTGEIRITAPANATVGTTVSFPVTVVFPDKSRQIHEVTVYVERTTTAPSTSEQPTSTAPTGTAPTNTTTPAKPKESQADKSDVDFENPKVNAGGTIVQRPSGNAPAGTKFTGPNGTYDGWKFATDPNTGEVTITPPADAKPGASIDYTVTATFPDWSTKDYKLKATVAGGGDVDKGGDTGSSSDNSSSSSSKEEGSSTGATIGIVVGVLALLGLLAGAANYVLQYVDINSLLR